MSTVGLPPGPRHPGPLQAVLWGLRYPEFTRSARRRYGATYAVHPGTMPRLVVTTDAGAIRALLTGDPLRKRHANDVVRPLIDDGSVILMDGPEHLARRKLLLPPFHGERVRAYAELMQRLMDEEVARWRPGEVVAILPIAQNVTIEVILQAVLGVRDRALRERFRRLIDNVLFYPMGHARLRAAGRFPAIRGPRRLRAAAAFAASLPTPAVMTYFPHLKARTPLNVMTIGWWRQHDRLMALLEEQIATTRADPRRAERDDILAMLVDDIPEKDLREDLITLIGAGHETTAAAIAWGTVLLAHHHDVRERALAAVRDGDDRWMGALVKEVLRYRSPLPLAAVRRLDDPLEIGGREIPAGTQLAIDAWGLHHDPERYPDPGRFRPERFLEDDTESYSWLPFGGGSRRCIGAALAELEIRIALTTILRSAAIEPADPELAPAARRGIVFVPHGGGRVRVRSVPPRGGAT